MKFEAPFCKVRSRKQFRGQVKTQATLEKEYGGINIPFGTSREENGEVEPCIEMQCSPRFIIYAQSFLSKELPDYRCLTYSFSADELVPA